MNDADDGERERRDDPESGSVRATYDRIAAHFSSTREYAWPEVEAFVDDERERRGSLGTALDLGCGNGRHAELLADRGASVVGLDVSRGLLDEARDRARDRGFDLALVHGDGATLPFADDRFDHAVYVATLHHLRPRDARVASLIELERVLASGGRALVSAWSTAHDAFEETEGFDTTVDWTLPGGTRVPRYYHVYDPDEFRTDLRESDLSVVDACVSSGNCYAVVGPRA
ncbi:class I SAM-dependent methyltransferase [Haloferacaceae archaeon DSL9]